MSMYPNEARNIRGKATPGELSKDEINLSFTRLHLIQKVFLCRMRLRNTFYMFKLILFKYSLQCLSICPGESL